VPAAEIDGEVGVDVIAYSMGLDLAHIAGHECGRGRVHVGAVDTDGGGVGIVAQHPDHLCRGCPCTAEPYT
jgi:hypothetical protein